MAETKKGKKSSPAGTVLLECRCEHEYQQKMYGARRVHNISKNKAGGLEARCSVCLTIHPLHGEQAPA